MGRLAMSNIEQLADVASQKPCIACGFLIPATATLCKECKSHQNWQRHLQVGQTSLALLVALFAVAGTGLGAIYGLIFGPNSELAVTTATAVEDGLTITVANRGERPGVFDIASIQMDDEGRGENHSSRVRFLPPADPVIPPGEIRIFQLAAKEDPGQAEMITDFLAAEYKSQEQYTDETRPLKVCSLDIRVVEFDGTSSAAAWPGACVDIWRALHPETEYQFAEIANYLWQSGRPAPTFPLNSPDLVIESPENQE